MFRVSGTAIFQGSSPLKSDRMKHAVLLEGEAIAGVAPLALLPNEKPDYLYVTAPSSMVKGLANGQSVEVELILQVASKTVEKRQDERDGYRSRNQRQEPEEITFTNYRFELRSIKPSQSQNGAPRQTAAVAGR